MSSRPASRSLCAAAAPGTTRVGSISALPRVLARLGIALDPILREAGLPPDLFADHDRLIAVTQAFQLMNLAAERASCPHIGLLCGAQHQPETIGLAGRLAQNARNVGSALRGLALNLHLNGHVFVPSLTVTGDSAEFALALVADIAEPSRVGVDLGFAGAVALVRALCGPDWSPTDIMMVNAPVGSRAPYDRIFRVRTRFGCDRNAIVFPKSWLDRPVHGADPAVLAALEKELAEIAQLNPLPPAVAARRALLACLFRGDLSARAVAAALGLEIRTLNRRLADEGTSVFALAKEVRYQVARDLLANTALPITEIAATLAYSNAGGLTRAFREWSGVSPRDWRRQHRPAAVPSPQTSAACAGRAGGGRVAGP